MSMPNIQWFLFDLGNVVIKLAYERVIAAICGDSAVDRDELLAIFESPGGIGYGLAIARKAMRAMAGDITIRNMPGKGCVFVLDMPLAVDAVPVS